MTEALVFKADGTHEAQSEIATLMAVSHADRWQVSYARWRAIMAMAGAGFLALLLVHLLALIVTGRPATYLIGLGAAFAGATAWRLLSLHSIKRLARSMAASSPLFIGPQTWTVDAEGVSIETPVSNSRFAWSTFDRVLSGRTAVGLSSGNIYFALPVPDDSDRATLVERSEAWMRLRRGAE